jgi:hypothetical protein
MFTMLSTVYPEYKWLPWKFVKTKNNFTKEQSNHKELVDDLGKQLNIKELSDWYKITNEV